MHFAPKPRTQPCARPLPSPASHGLGLLQPVLGHRGPSPVVGLHAATSPVSPLRIGDAIPGVPS